MWEPSPVNQRTSGGGRPAERTVGSAGLADSIARLRRALRRAARAADPANTLAVAQFELLASVSDNPEIRPGQLARMLNLRPNTVTTLVNSLAAEGMIERAPVPGDGRAVMLSVTDAGLAAVQAWQVTNNAVLNLALSSLTSGERTALTRAVPALAALASAIDQLADTDDAPADPDKQKRRAVR
jgi:DNA-binding MarR family transcriptional regulator